MVKTNNIATLVLLPNRFQIAGPQELVLLTMNIVGDKSLDNEQIKQNIEDLWSKWYVRCSASGDYISLDTLKYWDVERQEVFARPELVSQRRQYDHR